MTIRFLLVGQRDLALKEINATISLFPGLAAAYALRGKLRNAIGQYMIRGVEISRPRCAYQLRTNHERLPASDRLGRSFY
jgi:hypothetical protein